MEPGDGVQAGVEDAHGSTLPLPIDADPGSAEGLSAEGASDMSVAGSSTAASGVSRGGPPMKLFLVTHTIAAATAKMPLHMMILLQHVSTPSPSPPAFRCRQILPASGTVSVSVWDGSGDAAMLKDYLDGVLNGDASPGDPLYCDNAVHELVEDFMWGIARDMLRARAAGRVASTVGAGARQAISTIKGTAAVGLSSAAAILGDFDQRLQVSGAAARALQASSTAASQALQMSRRALEHQAVASGVRTVNDTVKRGWGFLSSAMSSVLGQVATAATDFNAQSSVRPFHYGDHGGDDYDNETAGDYAHVGPANEGAAMGGDGAGEGGVAAPTPEAVMAAAAAGMVGDARGVAGTGAAGWVPVGPPPPMPQAPAARLGAAATAAGGMGESLLVPSELVAGPARGTEGEAGAHAEGAGGAKGDAGEEEDWEGDLAGGDDEGDDGSGEEWLNQ